MRQVRFGAHPDIPACAPIFPERGRTKEPFRDVVKATLFETDRSVISGLATTWPLEAILSSLRVMYAIG